MVVGDVSDAVRGNGGAVLEEGEWVEVLVGKYSGGPRDQLDQCFGCQSTGLERRCKVETEIPSTLEVGASLSIYDFEACGCTDSTTCRHTQS